MPVAWATNSQIAVLELRRGQCPFYEKYGYYPTNLAIIDLTGHVTARGPCIAGILAGPKGLIYVQYKQDSGLTALMDDILDKRKGSLYFSTDGGTSWQNGSPAFEDEKGNVYSFSHYAEDGTLVGPGGNAVARNLFDAQWSQ
jgi:hypothetical protein